jgi:hypothetical protein
MAKKNPSNRRKILGTVSSTVAHVAGAMGNYSVSVQTVLYPAAGETIFSMPGGTPLAMAKLGGSFLGSGPLSPAGTTGSTAPVGTIYVGSFMVSQKPDTVVVQAQFVSPVVTASVSPS